MADIPQQISYLVEKQFPAFYREEGQNFIAFMEAYYEWLESADQPLGRSRKLLTYFDVDKSIDQFVNSFKQKYLVNFPLLAETDQKLFVKKATEIYRSKGSERAIELLFRLLFNEDINVYYPTNNILRPSTGKWTRPVYIELSEAAKNKQFVGNLVTGATSGATAIVARLAKRTIAGKTFDVAYLTNLEGNFQLHEIVTYDGLIQGSPSIIGSLNEVLIENAGQNFAVGDVVEVLSDATGRQAAGIVKSIVPATGKVDYALTDGGSGYTLSSNVVVSEKVITFANFVSNSVYTTNFAEQETVKQDLTYVPFTAANRGFANGQFVYGVDTSSGVVNIASGYIVEVAQDLTAHTGTLIINETPSTTIAIGSVSQANTTGSFAVGELVYQIDTGSDFKKSRGYVLYANSSTAIIDESFGPFTVGERMIGATTNCSANVSSTTTLTQKFTNGSITEVRTPFVVPSANALVVTNQIEDRTVSGEVVGSNTRYLGLYNIDAAKAFKSGLHAWVYGVSSNSHANVVAVSTGRVGGFDVGSLTDEEQIYVNPDIIDSNNSANVNYLTITIDGAGGGIGSNVGFVDYVTVVSGGSGYSNSSTVTFTGGSPSALAQASVNTFANGTIQSIIVANTGAGYDSKPTIAVSGGTGANLTVVMDPGYGFPKNTNGDYYSIIDTCLRKTSATVGTIASLTNIDPGANNTASPFVRVINPDVAGFGRRNYRLNISGNTKPFVIGETLTQEVYQPIVTLNISGFTSNFNAAQLETIKQVRADGNTVYGELITFTGNTIGNTAVLRVKVDNISNTFNTSNSIIGLTSNATGTTVSSLSTTTSLQLAKGRVIANTATSIDIFRTRFNTSFSDGSVIYGSTSGAQATIQSIADIDPSPIYGKNAIITAPARSAEGTIDKVEIINSGFAYTNNEIVTLRASNNQYIATGFARLIRQGEGEGYWEDTGGFLSSDQLIQDSDFYQDFSYQIESSLSLDLYANVVKDTVHMAGTKTFGRVNRSALLNTSVTTEDLADRAATITLEGGNNGEFNIGEEVAQYSGNTKVANGTLDSVISYVTVQGANTEFVIGGQVSRPSLFANTSYGEIEGVTYDYGANNATLALTNVRGMFESTGEIQTKFDRIQLTYTLTSYTSGLGGPVAIDFIYPEVVYQSNGTANVGVGNITSANSTHLIIKPATRLSISSQTGTISPGDTIYQRANSSAPNTAIGVVGLANSTTIEVIDPRGQFEPGQKALTTSANAQVIAVVGKSDAFTKSNTVVISINNLTDIGFLDGETISQPATGATGTLSLGNTSSISVNDVSGTFNTIDPIFGGTSGVQADVSRISGPFSIIGAESGANAQIGVIQSTRVTTTLDVDTSVGALNTFGISNVSGQFLYNSTVVGVDSLANGTITTVQIQAY